MECSLHYKGYTGSVDYSVGDGCYYGKIEGIRGLVNYEGDSLEELKAAFEESVEDYIKFCVENCVEPQRCYE